MTLKYNRVAFIQDSEKSHIYFRPVESLYVKEEMQFNSAAERDFFFNSHKKQLINRNTLTMIGFDVFMWTGDTDPVAYDGSKWRAFGGGNSTPPVLYSPYVGATDLANGAEGLVPQPLAGEESFILAGDGNWTDPASILNLPVEFGGSTAGAAGSKGLVPAPSAGDQAKVLRGDGTWTDFTVPVLVGANGIDGSQGLVPTPTAGQAEYVLLGDGTWTKANQYFEAATEAALPDGVAFHVAEGTFAKVDDYNSTGTPALMVFKSGAWIFVLNPEFQSLTVIDNWDTQDSANPVSAKVAYDLKQLIDGLQAVRVVEFPSDAAALTDLAKTEIVHIEHSVEGDAGSDWLRYQITDAGDGTWGNATKVLIAEQEIGFVVFLGATGGGAGTVGYVPAPLAGEQDYYLKGDGTWSEITGLSPFVGATQSVAGTEGLVPQPSAASYQKILRGDGQWVTLATALADEGVVYQYNDFVGATGVANGSQGFVPAPLIADEGKFLKGDGTWAELPAYIVPVDFVGATASVNGVAGLVPAPLAGQEGFVLLGDGTWADALAGVLTSGDIVDFVGATASVDGQRGYVPQPLAGDEGKFLKGDGTWEVVNAAPMVGATDVADGSGGTVPAPLAGDDTKYLIGDGTWGNLEAFYDVATETSLPNTALQGTPALVANYQGSGSRAYLNFSGSTWKFILDPDISSPEVINNWDTQDGTKPVSAQVAYDLKQLIDGLGNIIVVEFPNDAAALTGLVVSDLVHVEHEVQGDTGSGFIRYQITDAGDGTWANATKVVVQTQDAGVAVFTGATALLDGTTGYVPKPLAGEESKILLGDSTWASFSEILTNEGVTIYENAFTGATGVSDGALGLVPAPLIAEKDYFLKGDGTWTEIIIPAGTVMTGATSGQDGAEGLVPQPLAGDEDKVLHGDGTFRDVAVPVEITWDLNVITGTGLLSAGNGYLVDTTASAFALTLPAAPSINDKVKIKDYGFSSETNNITIQAAANMDGVTDDFVLSYNGKTVEFVFVGGAVGWLVLY